MDQPPASNIVSLDFSRFGKTDLQKIETLRRKIWMLRRWCRVDRVVRDGREWLLLYSGDRGPQPYACYHLLREDSGHYALLDGRTATVIARERTMDAAIEAIPEDFYYTSHGKIH